MNGFESLQGRHRLLSSADATTVGGMDIQDTVILIDGPQLDDLLIDGVRVTTTATYEIKKVDSDYFSEE